MLNFKKIIAIMSLGLIISVSSQSIANDANNLKHTKEQLVNRVKDISNYEDLMTALSQYKTERDSLPSTSDAIVFLSGDKGDKKGDEELNHNVLILDNSKDIVIESKNGNLNENEVLIENDKALNINLKKQISEYLKERLSPENYQYAQKMLDNKDVNIDIQTRKLINQKISEITNIIILSNGFVLDDINTDIERLKNENNTLLKSIEENAMSAYKNIIDMDMYFKNIYTNTITFYKNKTEKYNLNEYKKGR